MYFLKKKYVVLTKFKRVKTDVVIISKLSGQIEMESSIQRGSKPTAKRWKFNSKVFKAYCKEHGIRHSCSPLFTTKKNGAAKTKNQTILNMIRSMLNSKSAKDFLN